MKTSEGRDQKSAKQIAINIHSLQRERVLLGNKFPEMGMVNVAILDDDPLFCELMHKTAQKCLIPCVCCTTVQQLAELMQNRQIDIVVVDYNLGSISGLHVAENIGTVPVVLISHTGRMLRTEQAWPQSVVDFVPKKYGAMKILEVALSALFGDVEKRNVG